MTVKIRPYRNEKGFYEVDITIQLNPNQRFRRRYKCPERGRAAAKRWGAEKERELIEQGPGRKTTQTVADFAPAFYRWHESRNKANTVERMKGVTENWILPTLGNRPLSQIGSIDVEKLHVAMSKTGLRPQTREKGLSPRSKNVVLSALRGMLALASERGILRDPPKIPRVAVPKSIRRVLTPDEYRQLLGAVEGLTEKTRAATRVGILLGGDAGLREGEIRGLRWSDCDWARGRLLIQQQSIDDEGAVFGPPKWGGVREIPMSERLAAALRELASMPTQTLVLSRLPHVMSRRGRAKDKRPVPQGWMRSRLDTLARGLGWAPFGPHTLRHTFCTGLAATGVPANTIRVLAGHGHLATTERYIHAVAGREAWAISMLENATRRHDGAGESGENLETAKGGTPKAA